MIPPLFRIPRRLRHRGGGDVAVYLCAEANCWPAAQPAADMKLRFAEPGTLIDLGRIAELRGSGTTATRFGSGHDQ